MSRVAALVSISLFTAELLMAQGLPFHTQTALTTSFEEKGLRVFTSIQSRGNATFAATPLVVLPFAPHQRVTTSIALPLMYKRLTPSSGSGGSRYANVGIGDVTISAKWAFWIRNRFAGTTRLAVMASGSLPTGSTSATLNGGDLAPPPLQLGAGAVSGGATLVGTIVRGRWGLNIDVGHVWHAAHGVFRTGAVTRYNIAIGLRIPDHIQTIRTKTLQLYLEWNGSVAARNQQAGSDDVNSGGHVAYLSPGLQWVVLPQLLLESSVQIPVIQDFHGTQPDFGIRPALGARFLFF